MMESEQEQSAIAPKPIQLPEPLDIHPLIRQVIAWRVAYQQYDGGISPMWYRGHADASWDLLPGVLRNDFLATAMANLPACAAVTIPANAGLLLERVMNQQFLREAAGLLSHPENLATIYFEGQHHGLPTRLLDWTTDPLVALFFASVELPGVDGSIEGLNPLNHYYYDLMSEDLNSNTVRTRRIAARTPVKGHHEAFVGQLRDLFEEFDPQRSVLPAAGADPKMVAAAAESGGKFQVPTTTLNMVLPVLPGLDFTRITSQRGCFTFHPFGSGPVNALRSLFSVPAQEKQLIVRDLMSMGIDWARIYPDLAGTCRALKLRFGL